MGKQRRNRSFPLRQVSIIVGLALLLGVSLLLALHPHPFQQQAQTTSCQQIGIPAYFGGSMWDQVVASYPTTTLMVANGNGGPSNVSASPSQIQTAKAKGIRVLGYVATGYGSHAISAVESEIDTWRNSYSVTDIFFDEGAQDSGHIPYYTQLTDYVHSKTPGSLTMLNIGGNPSSEQSMTSADIIVNFEGSYSNYVSGFTPASWVNNYPASRFSQLIHHAPDAQSMQNAVRLAQQHHAGYVYVMNDNQWGQIPFYWLQEVAAVSRSCPSGGSPSATTAPAPSFITPSYNCIGACPTLPPTQSVPSAAPTISSVSQTPSLPPSQTMPSIAPLSQIPPSTNTGGQRSGWFAVLLQLLLDFIRKLLQIL